MRSKTSDAKLINLFLDMLAAEQGAGDNTLDAYRGDLTDLHGFLAGSGKGFADVETEALRDYLADLDARGFKSSSVARGCRRCGTCFASCSTSGFAATIPPPSCPARSAAAACRKCCRYRTWTGC